MFLHFELTGSLLIFKIIFFAIIKVCFQKKSCILNLKTYFSFYEAQQSILTSNHKSKKIL